MGRARNFASKENLDRGDGDTVRSQQKAGDRNDTASVLDSAASLGLTGEITGAAWRFCEALQSVSNGVLKRE